MESNSEASCISDPNFAVICAFLERFAASCGISYPPFMDLQEMLENIDEVPQELVDLHIMLLRKARKAVFREKWEKALIKFCHSYSTQDGWEIERFGYKNSRLEVKLRVLKSLLEGQFDLNSKFKTTINTLEANELRSKPLGKDKLGRIYWLQIDPTSNIRVYREDLDEESWNLVAKDRDSLVQLLQELSADENTIDVNLFNEDSTVSVEIEKNVLDTGQESLISDTEVVLTNGELQVEEKDPLEVKDIGNVICNEKNESPSENMENDGKRIGDNIEEDRELKKLKLDDMTNGTNGLEVGEAIEEPVIHVYGEGNGVDCDAGNTDKEDDKNNEGNSSSAAEKVEAATSDIVNTDAKKMDSDNKPQPKLWSIDTICGTGNLNHTGDGNSPGKNIKGNQKNFSSFSIESVLEKKLEPPCTSSVATDSAVISVNNSMVCSASINSNDKGKVGVNIDLDDTISRDSELNVDSVKNEMSLVCNERKSTGEKSEDENIKCEQDPCDISTLITSQKSVSQLSEELTPAIEKPSKELVDYSLPHNIYDPQLVPQNNSKVLSSKIVSNLYTNTEENKTDNRSTCFHKIDELVNVGGSDLGHVKVAEDVQMDILVNNENLVGNVEERASESESKDTVSDVCETMDGNASGTSSGQNVRDFAAEFEEVSSAKNEEGVKIEDRNSLITAPETLMQSFLQNSTEKENIFPEDCNQTDTVNNHASETSNIPDTSTNNRSYDESVESTQINSEMKCPETDIEGTQTKNNNENQARNIVNFPVSSLNDDEPLFETSSETKSQNQEEAEKTNVTFHDKSNDGKLSDGSHSMAVTTNQIISGVKLFKNDGEEANNDAGAELSTEMPSMRLENDKYPKHSSSPEQSQSDEHFTKHVLNEKVVKPGDSVIERNDDRTVSNFEEKIELAQESPNVKDPTVDNSADHEVPGKTNLEVIKDEYPLVSNSELLGENLDKNVTCKDAYAKESERNTLGDFISTETALIKEEIQCKKEAEEEANFEEKNSLVSGNLKENIEEEGSKKADSPKAEDFDSCLDGIQEVPVKPDEETSSIITNSSDEISHLVKNQDNVEKSHSPVVTEKEEEVEQEKQKGDLYEKPLKTESVEIEMVPAELQATSDPETVQSNEKDDEGNDEQVKERIEESKPNVNVMDGKSDEINQDLQNSDLKNEYNVVGEDKADTKVSPLVEESCNEMSAQNVTPLTVEVMGAPIAEDSENQSMQEELTEVNDSAPDFKNFVESEHEDLMKDPLALDDPKTAPPGDKEDYEELQTKLDSSKSEENPKAAENGVVGRKKRRKKKLKSRNRKKVEKVKVVRQRDSSDEEKSKEDSNKGETNEKTAKAKPKESTPRVRQLIPEREIKHLGISNMEQLPTIRQSRRIAQLKLKEEAERNRLKKLQEEASKENDLKETSKSKKKSKSQKSGKQKRKAEGESEYEVDEDSDEKSKQKEEKIAKKKRKKDKLVFDEMNPWISSSGSSTVDEEEEEIEDEPHEEEEILFKSDHEFSPESDVEDPDYKPIKRARTAKVDSKDQPGLDSKYDDTACEKCGEKDHPEWILLCDKCDKGWHASCVRPALMVVPEGDWFCPPCEHTSLIQRLRESLVEYDKCQKQRENEELRKKRLAFVGISLDNVLPTKKDKKQKVTEGENNVESDETESDAAEDDSSSSESSSSGSDSSDESSEPVYQLRERRSNITSYRYNEYDELIKSALQEEIDAIKEVEYPAKETTDAGNVDSEVTKETILPKISEERNDENGLGAHLPQADFNNDLDLPADIMKATPKIRPKKKDSDVDYEVESDEDDDDEYNAVDDEEQAQQQEDEALADEVPPVVPRYDKKKKKSRSLNIRGLDFTSDEEEDNSDSDFKGESSEEESEFSLPSESESSDGIRRKKKGFDGPVRRSTRARTARYDREFINDDSDDESPKRKKSRNKWVTSESSDSDRSWGRRKKKTNRSGYRSTVPRKSKAKAKKKKNKKRIVESDEDGVPTPKKAKNRKIKFGGLDDLDEEQVLTRRTRGKKINYQEINASDSDDEPTRRRPRVIGESDEEFIAEKEKSDAEDSDGEDELQQHTLKQDTNEKAISKKSILEKVKKKKKRHVIPDPDDFSEDDLLEDEELDEFAEELGDLDDEEEKILGEMLNDGDVPIHELKVALKKLKERRGGKNVNIADVPKPPYPPVPSQLDNPSIAQRYPKMGNMNIPPCRSELVAQLGIPPDPAVSSVRTVPNLFIGKRPGEDGLGSLTDRCPSEPQSGLLLQVDQKLESKDPIMNLQPPPYPAFVPEAPAGVLPSLVNPQQFPMSNRPPIPPYNSFQGIITPHLRMPPEYQPPSIPTAVLGLENDSLADRRKLVRKPGTKTKPTRDGSVSPPVPDVREENSSDGRISTGDLTTHDSPPKRRGRGRGKKQLLAEARAKQEMGMSTVQAPTQFPAQGLAPEGGSVITRMLNTPQGPQPFLDFPIPGRGRPPFRPPFPNTIRPPLNATPPSTSRLRAPGSALFHSPHALDSAPTGEGSISLPQAGKPAQQAAAGFIRSPVLPRYPTDAGLRPPFPSQSSPNRTESYPYPNFYGGFPPHLSNSEDAPFHNPNFPVNPFDEHNQASVCDGTGPAGKPTFEDEAGGEFGGLASYFASQREDDLDT